MAKRPARRHIWDGARAPHSELSCFLAAVYSVGVVESWVLQRNAELQASSHAMHMKYITTITTQYLYNT